MPVPVPLYDKEYSAHKIHKLRPDPLDGLVFRGRKPAFEDGTQYVIQRQDPAHHSLSSSSNSRGARLSGQQELSHCIGDRLNSAIHLVETHQPSETADSRHGLIPAADAGFSQQGHAEACSLPAWGSNRTRMTISTHQRGSLDVAWSGYDAVNGIHAVGYPGDAKGWAASGAAAALAHSDELLYRSAQEGFDSVYGCESNHQIATPFAEYVDRMVASDAPLKNEPVAISQQSQREFVSPVVPHRLSVPLEPLSNPAYIKAYRSMSEPLSNWMAIYVWKSCVSDVGLAQRFGGAFRSDLVTNPSTVLTKSINTVLCSTLLQPSAIFLALWYISRLPVHFEDPVGVELTPAQCAFRAALFSEVSILPPMERQNELRRRTPFRIILLGFMLANKWLDDHTFSNKTWQNVSEEPIQAINGLEFAALAALQHDLSVSPKAWEAWLYHLQHYQSTQSPYPSPIGRPSTMDGNSLARKMIHDLIALNRQGTAQNAQSFPMFSPLLLCESEKEELVYQPGSFDPFDIDLDEDGPLKEEYVPRRRSSLLGPKVTADSHYVCVEIESQTQLPPPSEWSPQGDPLLQPEFRGRSASIARTAPGHGRSFSAFVQPPYWNQFDQSVGKGMLQPGFSTASNMPVTWPPFSQSRTTLANGVPAFPPPYGAHAQSVAWSVPPETFSAPVHGCGRFAEQPPPYSHLAGDSHTFRPLWLRT